MTQQHSFEIVRYTLHDPHAAQSQRPARVSGSLRPHSRVGGWTPDTFVALSPSLGHQSSTTSSVSAVNTEQKVYKQEFSCLIDLIIKQRDSS